ncbi:sarcocystatin-A-like [Scaptodrosophila lebanonensis]|uniref:Sarcocystatin-A-like n=1 Tax=Drosophila lebanonensis TaxID=7225 RepID=A0A6J2TKD9_DROLE|nr:sarcocystatin-A-like [Scaptodrosophila lebanonensis]
MFVAKLLLVCSATFLVANALPQGFGALGAPSQLSGSSLQAAEETLRSSLTKLASGDGPSYRLSKILSASYQVVSGSLNKYRAELVDGNGSTKVCDIDIWSQSWLPNGIQVTFRCAGEPELVKNHNA